MERRDFLATSGFAVSQGAIGNSTETTNLDASKFGLNIRDSPFGARGNGQVNDGPALQRAINARPYGGIIYIPVGHYRIDDSIILRDGITLIGEGKRSVDTSQGTWLDFRFGNPNTSPIIGDSLSDAGLVDLYVSGSLLGQQHQIRIVGKSRRIRLDRLVVKSNTAGAAISLGDEGYTIQSTIRNTVVVNAGVGFQIGKSCTSISIDTCFANACRGAGYLVRGTYISLTACAADTNGIGYQISNAAGINLSACGAEQSKYSAFEFGKATRGLVLQACRAHESNFSGNRAIPSFASLDSGAQGIVMLGCVDTAPSRQTVFSVARSDGKSGNVANNIVFQGCSFALPITN